MGDGSWWEGGLLDGWFVNLLIVDICGLFLREFKCFWLELLCNIGELLV